MSINPSNVSILLTDRFKEYEQESDVTEEEMELVDVFEGDTTLSGSLLEQLSETWYIAF